MKKISGPHWESLILPGLAALWLWQGALLFIWLKRDQRPPAWDPAVHLLSALRGKRAISDGNLGALLRARPSPGHPPYPPLAHILQAAGMALAPALGLGVEDGAVFFANFIFFGILIAGAYIFAHVSWGRKIGLGAAILAGLAPPLLFWSHEGLIDLGVVAWTVLAYGLWMASEDFTERLPSLALGVVLALGMLTKWTFPSYVLPILIFAAARLFSRDGPASAPFMLGIAALLAAPWYAVNLFIVLPKILRAASLGAQEGDPSAATLAGWFYYPGAVWRAWTPVLCLAAVAGTAWAFLRRPSSALVLIGWFFSGLLFWTFVSNKDPRYVAPAAAALALAAAAMPGFFRHLLAALAIAFSGWVTLGPKDGFWVRPPAAEAWPLDDIVGRVEKEGGLVTLVANHAALSGNTLTWVVARRGFDDHVFVRTKLDNLGQFAQWVLVKTGDLGPPGSTIRQEAARAVIFEKDGWFGKIFREAARWPLPDGSEAVLFRRGSGAAPAKGPAAVAIWAGILNGVEADDVKGSWGPSARYAGAWAGSLSASRLAAGPLTLERVGLSLDGVVVTNAPETRLLDVKVLDVRSARWSEAGATALLNSRARSLKEGSVRFLENNGVEIRGKAGFLRLTVTAELRLLPEKRLVQVSARRVVLGRVPIPLWLLGPWKKTEASLGPSTRLPFAVSLAGLRTVAAAGGKPGYLEVAR